MRTDVQDFVSHCRLPDGMQTIFDSASRQAMGARRSGLVRDKEKRTLIHGQHRPLQSVLSIRRNLPEQPFVGAILLYQHVVVHLPLYLITGHCIGNFWSL
jgi:hypothetical protein